jgi:hypothetical protein
MESAGRINLSAQTRHPDTPKLVTGSPASTSRTQENRLGAGSADDKPLEELLAFLCQGNVPRFAVLGYACTDRAGIGIEIATLHRNKFPIATPG